MTVRSGPRKVYPNSTLLKTPDARVPGERTSCDDPRSWTELAERIDRLAQATDAPGIAADLRQEFAKILEGLMAQRGVPA